MLTTMERNSRPQRKINGGLTSNIVTVTPEIANAWLDVNVKNRKVKKRAVDQYARDMLAGDWKLTGDAIRFDTQNNLIDGQHRLMACVKAGVAFDSFVMYGLPTETQMIIDAGIPRRAADAVYLAGIASPIVVAAMAKVLIKDRTGTENSLNKCSNTEIMRCIEKHSRMPQYAIGGGIIPRGLPLSCVSYVLYVAAVLLNEKDRADAMIKVLKTGLPDYKGDPIHMYRERAMKTGDTALRAPQIVHLNTIKHCWNLFAKKEAMSQLRWIKTDVAIEGLNRKKL